MQLIKKYVKVSYRLNLRRRKMKKTFKTIENIIYTIIIIFFIWFMVSFINVVMHNNNDQQYASWNMFVIMEENYERYQERV